MAKRLDLSLANVGVDFLTREVVGGTAVSPEQQHDTIQMAAQTLAAMPKTAVSQATIGEFIETLPVSEAQRSVFRTRLQCSFGTNMHNIALRMLGDRSSPLRQYDDKASGDTLYFPL